MRHRSTIAACEYNGSFLGGTIGRVGVDKATNTLVAAGCYNFGNKIRKLNSSDENFTRFQFLLMLIDP